MDIGGSAQPMVVDVLIILTLLYPLVRTVYRIMRTTTSCTTCGKAIMRNDDPHITDCWACEVQQYQ